MDIKKATKLMKEGEKIFIPSEPGHIYGIENGEEICSCGQTILWKKEYLTNKGWKKVKIKGLDVKKLKVAEVGFYMDEDNTEHIDRILKNFTINKDEVKE